MEAWRRRSTGPQCKRDKHLKDARVLAKSRSGEQEARTAAGRRTEGREGPRAVSEHRPESRVPPDRKAFQSGLPHMRFDWGRRERDRGTQAAADHHTPGLETAGPCLSPSWRLEGHDPGLADLKSRETRVLPSRRLCLPAVASRGRGRQGALWGLFYKDPNPMHGGPALITRAALEAPPPKAITGAGTGGGCEGFT